MILKNTSKRIAQKSADADVLLLYRQRDRKCKASWYHIPWIVKIKKEQNKDKRRRNNAMPNSHRKWRRSRATRSTNGPDFPLCTCLDRRDTAGTRGIATLQVTTVGSNSTSSAGWFSRKRSHSIPSEGGSDMACGRYIHKYIDNCTINIKIWLSLQICMRWSYRLVCWVPTSEAQLPSQVKAVPSD